MMTIYKRYLLAATLILIINAVNAQTINWAGLKKENKHIINANIGFEYGATYGLGYSYQLKTKALPAVLGFEYSSPSGNKFFDDLKAKIGGQIRWVKYNDLQFSTRIQGVFRKYETEQVRLLNFGSDMSGIVGYYRAKWFVAAEVGFDKAIVTDFRHTKAYKDQYPGVVDGWYEPATGGNFYYGLQAGFSGKHYDVYLKAGKLLSQDFTTTPLIPVYAQVGYNIKF